LAPFCKSRWKKIIGKPYSGKLNVRIDEGELEIEPSATTPALYSTELLMRARLRVALTRTVSGISVQGTP
jgi:hypothetical protein